MDQLKSLRMMAEWPYVMRERQLEVFVDAWLGGQAHGGGPVVNIVPIKARDAGEGWVRLQHPGLRDQPDDYVIKGGEVQDLIELKYLTIEQGSSADLHLITVTQDALDLFDVLHRDGALRELRRRVDAID